MLSICGSNDACPMQTQRSDAPIFVNIGPLDAQKPTRKNHHCLCRPQSFDKTNGQQDIQILPDVLLAADRQRPRRKTAPKNVTTTPIKDVVCGTTHFEENKDKSPADVEMSIERAAEGLRTELNTKAKKCEASGTSFLTGWARTFASNAVSQISARCILTTGMAGAALTGVLNLVAWGTIDIFYLCHAMKFAVTFKCCARTATALSE